MDKLYVCVFVTSNSVNTAVHCSFVCCIIYANVFSNCRLIHNELYSCNKTNKKNYLGAMLLLDSSRQNYAI